MPYLHLDDLILSNPELCQSRQSFQVLKFLNARQVSIPHIIMPQL